MNVLVTGGAGSHGVALATNLVAHGHSVRLMDDFSSARMERLAPLGRRVEFVSGDVRDASAVRKAVEGIDIVWHAAFVNERERSSTDPGNITEVAVKGTLNVLDASLASGVRRFVLASSSHVYGTPTRVPTKEDERLVIDDIRDVTSNSYVGGNIAAELMTLHYGQARGLDTVIYRSHDVYGPDMGFRSLIPVVVAKIMRLSDGLRRRSLELPLYVDGSHTRAFCYFEDAADGARLAGISGATGEIYHLGVDVEVSVRHVVERIAAALGVSVEIIPGHVHERLAPRRCPDISKLRGLGYEPRTSLAVGLDTTVAWYREFFASTTSVAVIP